MNSPSQTERIAQANGIEICYETFGEPDSPPLLLIMGLGGQMISWDDAFCEALAQHGFYVIRFDNRDVGRSTRFPEAKPPSVRELMAAVWRNKPLDIPYTLSDMANDAVGLLQALGIASAHIVGISMGGMIAQLVAIHHPDRVRSLTSIMSSTGEPERRLFLRPKVLLALIRPGPTDPEGQIEHGIKVWRLMQGPDQPFDVERARRNIERARERGDSPDGMARQLAAIVAAGSRKEALSKVTAPTLVIHGEADPLLSVQSGIATAQAIPGARLLLLPGVGHGIPVSAAPKIVAAIVEHATQVEKGRSHDQ